MRKGKNRMIEQMHKKISVQLGGWIFGCFLLAALIGVVGFFSLHGVGRLTGLFRTAHVSFEEERKDLQGECIELMDHLYQNDWELEELWNHANQLPGKSYLTDGDGKILYLNDKDRGEGALLSLSQFRVGYNAKNEEEEFYGIYPVVVGEKNYYLLNHTIFKGDRYYTDEAIYIIAAVLATIVFFLSILYGVMRKVTYITQIGKDAKTIALTGEKVDVEVRGEDELAVIATNLNDMQNTLLLKIKEEKELNRREKELLTNLSHDLKTPVTIIMGYLDILKKGIQKNDTIYQLDEKQVEYITKSYDKTVDLNEMIEKLLNVVREDEQGKELKKENVNLSLVIKQIHQEFQEYADQNKLTLVSEFDKEPIYMDADVEKLVAIFHNLYSNAIKYCEPGKEIKSILKTESHRIHFSIQNGSKQIEEEELEHLYDKFYRADKARNSKIQGNGIGLHIVKKYVEWHEGKTWAEYKDGELIFHVTFLI